MKTTPLGYSLILFAFFVTGCEKSPGPVTGIPPAPPAEIPQGNYSGQKLVISTTEKTASPWLELNSDTLYSTFRNGSTLLKNIPVGFEDKIISVYVPKGYMAVFASNNDGTGESISLVANENPVKVNLPTRLRNNISYIRCIAINNPSKKGTCATNDTIVRAFNDAWYYGWSLTRSSFVNQQFVPMTWGKGSCTEENVQYLTARRDIDHLLSFNEPDNAGQSNIPNIDTAVVRYKIMQKTGLRLGSPVVEQDEALGTGKWLSNFMIKAQSLQLRIDFIAVHWYDWGNQTNNAATDSLTAERVFNRFVSYMGKIRQAYPNHPVWVTEYNANINRTSQTIHRYFMKLSVDWMNATPYVERYSYFFPNTVPSALPDKSLTPIANYWKTLPSTASSLSGNLIADATPF